MRSFDTFDRYASDQESNFGPGLRKVASRRVISCDGDVCHLEDEEKVKDNRYNSFITYVGIIYNAYYLILGRI